MRLKMTSTIADLLSSSFHRGTGDFALDKSLISRLLHYGCDYYDMVRLLSNLVPMNCSIHDIEALQSLAPPSRPLKDFKRSSIRGMIPRWTGTKYHTGPIELVVEDIQHKCFDRQLGMFTYHSNLNLKNKRSVDDPYVLMITQRKLLFLDLNRRQTFTYSYCEEEMEDAKTGNL